MGYSIWAKVFFVWDMLWAELTKEFFILVIGKWKSYWNVFYLFVLALPAIQTILILVATKYGVQLVSYEKTTLEHTYFGCMKKRRRRVDLKSCMTLASYLAWVVLQIQNNTIKLTEQPMWTQNYFVLCKKWVPLTYFERLFLFLNDSEPLL